MTHNIYSGANLGERTARGALVLALRQAFGLVGGAATSVVLARLLGARDVGEFAVVNAVVFLPAMLLGDFGIGITLVSPFEEPSVTTWRAAMSLTRRTAAAFATMAVVMVGALLILGQTHVAGLGGLCSIGLVARTLRPVPSARLQRSGRFDQIAVAETIENIGYFVVVIGLAAAGLGSVAFAGAVAAKEAGATMWLWRCAPSGARSDERGSLRQLMRSGLPPQIAGGLIALTDIFQPIVIGSVLGVQSLGYVAWAYGIALTPMLLVSALDRVLLPAFSRLQNDPPRRAVWIERAVRLNCVAVVPLVVTLCVARRELIELLFGRQWLPAAGFFVAFAPAIVATAVSAPLVHAFNSTGQTRVGMHLAIRWFSLTWTLGLAATYIAGRAGFGWFYVIVQLGYLPLWHRGKRLLDVDVVAIAGPHILGCAFAIAATAAFDRVMITESSWSLIALLLTHGVIGIGVWALCVLLGGRAVVQDLKILLRHVLPQRTRRAPRLGHTQCAVPAPAQRLGYHPALDGLRAVAVIAVLLYHLHLPFTRGGFLGVDVFFALSGFLITALLIEEHSRNGSVALARFYARRALRLMPAMAVLILVGVVVAGFGSAELRRTTGFGLPSAATYTSNWVASFSGQSLGLFQHTWSLAIEEQFYLLWPPLLWVLLRRGTSRRALTGCLVAMIATGVAWTGWLAATSDGIDRVYYPLDTRFAELLIGALGAVVWMHRRRAVLALMRFAVPFGLGAFALVLPIADASAPWFFPIGIVATAVATTVVVLGIVAFPTSFCSRVLATRPLRHVGRISYGLYLWHFPVYEVLQARYGTMPVRYLVPVELGLAYGLAAISYLVIERPFLLLKKRYAVADLTPDREFVEGTLRIVYKHDAGCPPSQQLVGPTWSVAHNETTDCGDAAADVPPMELTA